MALSPPLPPELWLQVFVHLDSLALAACARLSSRLRPLAQARLFAHVYLLPRRRPPATALAPRSCSLALSLPRPPDACAKLLHLLSTSPRLAQLVKRVSIVDGTLFPSFRTRSDQSLAMREKLNGAQWFLSTSPHVLHALFQKLNLQSLDLIFPDDSKVSWNLIPRGIRSALDRLLTSPCLHSLQLCNISFDTPATLRHFTSTLSRGSITHLVLRNIKLYPDLPLSPAWKDNSSIAALLDCPEKKQTPCSRHAKSFFPKTHDPLFQPLTQSQTPSLTRSALRLESLCITSDSSQQDPDTLHLLNILFSDSPATPPQAPPLLSPYTLKRLSVPNMDKETLSEITRILEKSGVHKSSLLMHD